MDKNAMLLSHTSKFVSVYEKSFWLLEFLVPQTLLARWRI